MSNLSVEVQDAINKVEEKYKGWILGSIRQTFKSTEHGQDGSSPLSAFILVSCAIDFFAGFYAGLATFKPKRGESPKNYKDFVAKYISMYDPEDLYTALRCRLVHNYTIGEDIGLTHHNFQNHDPNGLRGHKILNFENFLIDFENGVRDYFNDLRADDEKQNKLREKFMVRYQLGFADMITIIQRT